MRPNLFDFATKELSQDAFIAWLIKWASPECQNQDGLLWECATRFVKKLLSLQIEPPPEIKSLSIGRQWENIDVWAEINGKYLVVIEDKTVTGEHSNQLRTYKNRATAWCEKNRFDPPICVYLKTGSESASVLNGIKGQGFAVFTRRDFLEILNQSKEPRCTNQIFNDFREHLQAMEDSEGQFLKKPIKDWDVPQWKGFYQALEKLRPVVKWEYVSNPKGGFWNLILNWHETKDCCPYMQIEQGPLCFKIGEVYENQSTVRERWHSMLMAHCDGNDKIRRPTRLKPGTYMTIARVERADWLGSDDDLVDMEKVVERLNDYESVYSGFIKKMDSEGVR